MVKIDSLERSVAVTIVKQTLIQSKGGFLVFSLVFGSALLYVLNLFFQLPISVWFFELFYSFCCFLAGYAIFREEYVDSDARRMAIESILEDIYVIDCDETGYREKLRKGIEYAGEVIFLLLEFSKKVKDKKNASEIFDDVLQILNMQNDSAEQAIKSQRILDLISNDRSNRKNKLLEDNISSMREYIKEAKNWIEDLNEKLKTLTLQVSQLETQISQRKISAANFAAETSTMIRQLQWTVDQRKTAAANVIKQLTE